MKLMHRLLILAFLQSFATIFVERGIFFYTTEILEFGKIANLLLALTFGVFYVVGALSSHAVSVRYGEKPLLAVALAGQVVFNLALAALPSTPALFVCNAALGLLVSLTWPVIESFISAGKTPAQSARAVGAFSISFAVAVPLTLLVSGPVIDLAGQLLFLIPAAVNAISLFLILPLPMRPKHLPHEHESRPRESEMRRLRGMLASSRWMLLLSYSAMWVLAALMPDILIRRLQIDVAYAAGLSGLLDVCRLGAFLVLHRWTGWHFRRGPLLAGLVAIQVGFFLVLLGGNLPTVLLGEVLFGLSAGIIYYSALYYGMVVTNASVDAGGKHEGLIGGGFAAGPLIGLAGVSLVPVFGSTVLANLVGVEPLLLVCSLAAIRQMQKAFRTSTDALSPPPADR